MGGSLLWNPRKDLGSFIPETHIKHLLCVDHQARPELREPQCRGSGLYLRSKAHTMWPCLSTSSQANIACNRWNFLLKE